MKGAIRMKKYFAVFAVWLLLSSCFSAYAANYDVVWINSVTSDRVHLRQKATTDSKSLGLYFTGTHAVILDEGEEWSYVMIGTEKGYVHNSLLSAEPVTAKTRLADIIAKGTLNLRAWPSKHADVMTRLPESLNLSVLGETHDHWSFVKAGDLYGYVMNEFLDTEGYVNVQPSAGYIPQALQGRWQYSSGAGAWKNVITIYPDGTFWGYFHDAAMGDTGRQYPNGTVYESHYTGHLSHIRRVSEYEYQLDIDRLQFFGIENNEKIENETRYVTVPVYGLGHGDQLSLYLPGAEQIPANAQRQYDHYAPEKPSALLYNHTADAAWIAE